MQISEALSFADYFQQFGPLVYILALLVMVLGGALIYFIRKTITKQENFEDDCKNQIIEKDKIIEDLQNEIKEQNKVTLEMTKSSQEALTLVNKQIDNFRADQKVINEIHQYFGKIEQGIQTLISRGA